MLNLSGVDECLNDYIKKELTVDDFFELMGLVTETIYKGQINNQILYLDTKTVRIRNGSIIFQRDNRSQIMDISMIKNFCKEITFETVFAVNENCSKVTEFLKFVDNNNSCTSIAHIQNFCDDASNTNYIQNEFNINTIQNSDETGVLDQAYLQRALNSSVSSRVTNTYQSSATQKIVQLVNTKNGSVTTINKDTFWIGKGADCDLRILDETVSRKHATIIVKNEHYFICDNESTNKTFVNNKAIPAKASVEIFDGTKIKFSNIEFSFRIEY